MAILSSRDIAGIVCDPKPPDSRSRRLRTCSWWGELAAPPSLPLGLPGCGRVGRWHVHTYHGIQQLRIYGVTTGCVCVWCVCVFVA